MLSLILIMLTAYLTGAIPSSIILGRITRGIDIRRYGSGNAGASNAIRVLGWKIGVIVALLDVGKGVAATLLISGIRLDTLSLPLDLVRIIAGFCAIVGHIWTIFAGFRGGKGVATGGGMIFSLVPLPAVICLVIFILVLLTVRIVSVASISTALSLPLIILILKSRFGAAISDLLLYFTIGTALLILYTHRTNIRRLLRGEESRFKKFWKHSTP